jgi:WD40 repeat protein
LTFSPDARRIVTANQDSTVKLWDATTGQEVLALKGHTGPVISVAFSRDGKRLASASEDGSVKIWDADSEEWPAPAEAPIAP